MKKIAILCCIILSFIQLNAQNEGVQFQELTFEQALEKAKAEGKLVFMDCYTSWCGPCQYMLKNVFVLPEMGAFFNDRFINVKYDMEKGTGPWLRGRFHVNAYPTFLIIRGDGVLQHRIVGSRPAADFLECVKRGAENETSVHYLDSLYRKRTLNKEELAFYRAALKDAKRDEDVKKVTAQEFKQLSDGEKIKSDNWYIFDQEGVSPDDERFVYLIEHKTDFEKQSGKETVDKRIMDNYLNVLINFNSSESIGDLLTLMKKQVVSINFEGKEQVEASIDYVEARNGEKIDVLLDLLEKKLSKLPRNFIWQTPFLDFIVKNGNKQQIDRYIALEENILELLDSDNLKKVACERFEKYRLSRNEK